MSRAEFISRATRDMERRLQIPRGWWGTRAHVFGPRGIEVKRTARCWTLKQHGEVVSRHDSRAFAIAKGRRLLVARGEK